MMDHNVHSPDVPIQKWSQQNCLVTNKTLNRWKLYLLCIARFPIGRGNAKAMSDAFPYAARRGFTEEIGKKPFPISPERKQLPKTI